MGGEKHRIKTSFSATTGIKSHQLQTPHYSSLHKS